MDEERARRARVFGAVATEYARYRPDYPAGAVDCMLEPLIGRPVEHLLDLAAGTGKLTGSLLDRADRVTAVEPDPAMLDQLRTAYPQVEAVIGTAEAIPVPDASVDGVLVGTAWHWFDPDAATAEIARVLRPGGVFAVVRNDEDPEVDWVTGYIVAARGRRPAGIHQDVFPTHPAFSASYRGLFKHVRPVGDVDGLLALLSTHSWSLMLDPADRAAAFDRIRKYMGLRPESSEPSISVPLVTTVVRFVRR